MTPPLNVLNTPLIS